MIVHVHMSCAYEDNLVILLDKTSLPHLRSSLSSVTVDGSVPPPPTTPTASSSGRRFLLAENRYGREEMLALMPDQPTRSPMNSELESILLDEALTPLALLPLTEEEQVCCMHHAVVVARASTTDTR